MSSSFLYELTHVTLHHSLEFTNSLVKVSALAFILSIGLDLTIIINAQTNLCSMKKVCVSFRNATIPLWVKLARDIKKSESVRTDTVNVAQLSPVSLELSLSEIKSGLTQP